MLCVGGVSLEGFEDLSALTGIVSGRAVSGLTRANVALTRSGLGSPSDYIRKSFVPAFSLETRPSDQRRRLSVADQVFSSEMWMVPSTREA